MTDKELRKLRREDLLQILISQQKQIDELNAALEDSEKALQDRRIAVEESGNIAEAALKLNEVFQRAQAAADHYNEEVRLRADALAAEAEKTAAEARKQADEILRQAKREAEALLGDARREAGQISREAQREAGKPVESTAKTTEDNTEKRRGGLLRRNRA